MKKYQKLDFSWPKNGAPKLNVVAVLPISVCLENLKNYTHTPNKFSKTPSYWEFLIFAYFSYLGAI